MNFKTDMELEDFCKTLESRGYKRFYVQPGNLDYGKYDFFYQKWMTDDVGKQYALNVKFFNYKKYNAKHITVPDWSCDAYLYLKTSELAEPKEEYGVAWLTFECPSIELTEKFAKMAFENLNGEYYERWNEC